MDKEIVVHIHNYSAIKRNSFESVLVDGPRVKELRKTNTIH